MSLRANWGLQAVGDAGDSAPDGDGGSFDPFSSASLAGMNLTADNDWMFEVSLDSPIEELERLLGLTQRSNNRLMNAGQDCELRWQPEVSCLACPLSEANNPGVEKCHLCRTSTQEERLTTILLAKQAGGV